jgi:hypothetical protein
MANVRAPTRTPPTTHALIAAGAGGPTRRSVFHVEQLAGAAG